MEGQSLSFPRYKYRRGDRAHQRVHFSIPFLNRDEEYKRVSTMSTPIRFGRVVYVSSSS